MPMKAKGQKGHRTTNFYEGYSQSLSFVTCANANILTKFYHNPSTILAHRKKRK